MASRGYNVISTEGNHEVGSLNTKWVKHMANGAMATESIDNYLLVETSRNVDGELECKALTDATIKGYLVTTVEEEDLLQTDGFSEEYTDFYNAKEEMVRITDVDAQKNARFETSAFELNADGVTNGGTIVTEVKKGQVAHFNPATKKYMISDATDPATAFATAVNTFEVVDPDSDFGYAFEKTTVRLMSL